MTITKKTTIPTQLTLVVSADTEDLEPIRRHTLRHFARQVKVPGFRAGKAPLNMIEKHVSQQAFADEFMEHALNELYGRAIDAEKIRPAAAPKVNVKKFVPYSLLEFEAELEVISPIKLPDYKKIKLSKKPINITAEDIKGVLDNLKRNIAERAEVERAARTGDELTIDFAGRDDTGKPVNGAEGKDYPLLLGSNTFIPGFEEHLLGAKAHESKEFTVKFPADYSVAALRSKNVTFVVEIKKVSELAQPKLDEAFVAKAGPFKSLAELKADIKKQLKSERELNAGREFENELIRAIVAESTVEAPKNLVDQQIMGMEEEEKRNLTYRGQTWVEHLAEEGITEDQHRERNRPEATARVQGGLVLSEIAEQEDIQVTPEELEIRIQTLKGQYQDPAMQGELDKPENRRDLTNRLMTEKTVAKLVDYASS